MNGRWKEGGLMIELLKTTRSSVNVDRMLPSMLDTLKSLF